jgi:hypothetical protein
MSLLSKIGFRCAVWVFAFCAVPISPVILIYGVPVLVGIVADVVQAALAHCDRPLIANAATWQQTKAGLVRGR